MDGESSSKKHLSFDKSCFPVMIGRLRQLLMIKTTNIIYLYNLYKVV